MSATVRSRSNGFDHTWDLAINLHEACIDPKAAIGPHEDTSSR